MIAADFRGRDTRAARRTQSSGGGLVRLAAFSEKHRYGKSRINYVQAHTVDSLHFQGGVLGQNFGNASWYVHFARVRLRSFGIGCRFRYA
jgi:hypothetical protein